jgi:hypothetical protein
MVFAEKSYTLVALYETLPQPSLTFTRPDSSSRYAAAALTPIAHSIRCKSLKVRQRRLEAARASIFFRAMVSLAADYIVAKRVASVAANGILELEAAGFSGSPHLRASKIRTQMYVQNEITLSPSIMCVEVKLRSMRNHALLSKVRRTHTAVFYSFLRRPYVETAKAGLPERATHVRRNNSGCQGSRRLLKTDSLRVPKRAFRVASPEVGEDDYARDGRVRTPQGGECVSLDLHDDEQYRQVCGSEQDHHPDV